MDDEFLLPANATRQVEEVAYAGAPNFARYRAITRYFYQQHLRLRDWLAPREVFRAIRRAVGPDYTEADCQSDVERLAEWHNLAKQRDESAARSVEEFNRPRFVYHITQFTIDFEELLLRHEGTKGTSGSLNATLLDRMWFRLEQLRQGLGAPRSEPFSPEQLTRDIQQPWADVLAAFTELREGAFAYHHTLSEVRPTDFEQVEAFRIYKATILEHLKGFIGQLQAYAPKIRALLARWESGGTTALLLRLLTEHDLVHKVSHLGPTKRPLTPQEIHDQVHGVALRGLAEWFAPTGGCDFLNTATSSAILQIVRQNERLATRHMIGVSRRRDLERLALVFATLDQPDDAHRLAARAFGAALPRHLRGASSDSYLLTDRDSVWRQPPQEQPLRRMRRGRVTATAVAAIQNRQERKDQLRREEEARMAEERLLWDEFFATPSVVLDRQRLADPLLRPRILRLVARCLLDPDRIGLATDGRRVYMQLPREPWAYGELIATDGTMILPQFTLTMLPDEEEDLADGVAVPAGASTVMRDRKAVLV